MSLLNNIEPKKVLSYFEEICSMPHGSGNTNIISNYLVKFANDRGLEVIQDSLGNVIIKKPGTTGYEKSAPVIIQGHMDMVCEKEDNCKIDFNKEGLSLKLDGNVLFAEGTTLGGDDGIAVAYALALLDMKEPEVEHPPLEVVITVDEEVGMLGAAFLDCSKLEGKLFLNIDSEEEGKLLVSCAGGVTVSCTIPVSYRSIENKKCMSIKVVNTTGGHSGTEIIKEGANATKILGRVLSKIDSELDINLVSISGGLKDNAIPRNAEAIISFSDDDSDNLIEIVREQENSIKNEYRVIDPDMKFVVETSLPGVIEDEMTDEATSNIIDMLLMVPNGIVRMSKDIDGLVEASLNLGIVNTMREEVNFKLLVRSSVQSIKDEIAKEISVLAKRCGGICECSANYPGWEYKEDSKLRMLMIDVYEKMYGNKPVIEAIHAGLECGLFAGKISDLDCVSFGPQIDDIHTTSERIYIDSINRTWKYILEILKRLK